MTNDIEFDLQRFLPYRLAVIAQNLSENLAKQYRSQFGITIPEWRVLVHVNQENGVSIRDIELRVAMEKSKVSRAAKRLEQSGYLTKSADPRDRRLLRLELTSQGEKLMAELIPIAKAYQKSLEQRLRSDYDGLNDGLSRLEDTDKADLLP